MEREWYVIADTIEVFGQLGVFVLAVFAYKQWVSSEKARRKKYYLDAFTYLDKGKDLLMWGPGNISESIEYYNKSLRIARLMLHEEIQKYIENVVLGKAHEAYTLDQELKVDNTSKALDSGVRKTKSFQLQELKSQLMTQEHEKIFRKFLD